MSIFGKKVIRIITIVTMLTMTVFSFESITYAAINKEISYQGKLLNTSSVAVSDGTYNMRFKLYTQSSGGVALWTETWCYSPDSGSTCDGTGTNSRVSVTSGLFSLMLGSTTALTSVNFNQTLYLGVEIGGTSNTPSWDGEMSPRKRIGAVPQAIEAEKINGLDSAQFLRTDAENATTSVTTFLYIKQSGAGDIANFFDDSTEVFSIVDGGNIGVASTTPFGVLSIGHEAGKVPLIVGSSTATTFIIDASGKIGIGTQAPGALLDVQGAAQFGSGNVNLIDSTGKIAGISSTYFASLDGSTLTSLSADNISSGTLGVARGGTGVSTYSMGDLLYASDSPVLDRLSIGGIGTILTSSGTAPQWSTSITLSGAVSGSYITASDAAATSTFAGGFTIDTNGLVYQKATGNVGIGILSPDAKLTVSAGDILLDNNRYLRGRDTDGTSRSLIGIDSSNVVNIGTSALTTSDTTIHSGGVANALYIRQTTGNVGIGTTTPNWKFQIAGTRPFSVLTDTSAGTNAKHWFTSTQGGNFYIGTSSDALSATSTYITIKNGGYVGIGTTAPAKKVDILDASISQLRLSQSTSVYSDFTVNSTGDLTVSLIGSGGDQIILNNADSSTGVNLFVCEGSACPTNAGGSGGLGTGGILTGRYHGGGNIIAEKAIVLGNGYTIQSTTSSSTVVHITDTTGATVITFDEY